MRSNLNPLYEGIGKFFKDRKRLKNVISKIKNKAKEDALKDREKLIDSVFKQREKYLEDYAKELKELKKSNGSLTKKVIAAGMGIAGIKAAGSAVGAAKSNKDKSSDDDD